MSKIAGILISISVLFGCNNSEPQPDFFSLTLQEKLEIDDWETSTIEPFTESDNGISYSNQVVSFHNSRMGKQKTFTREPREPLYATMFCEVKYISEDQIELSYCGGIFIRHPGNGISFSNTGIDTVTIVFPDEDQMEMNNVLYERGGRFVINPN